MLAGVAGALVGAFVDDWTELVAGAVGGVLGAVGAAIIVAGALRRGGTRAGLALIVAAVAAGLAVLAFVPIVGYLEAVAVPFLGRPAPPHPGRAVRGPAHSCQGLIQRSFILVVIDGLTPSMLEDTLERRTAPALALLASTAATAEPSPPFRR